MLLGPCKVLNRHIALMEVLQIQCTGTLIDGCRLAGGLQGNQCIGNLDVERGDFLLDLFVL